jgi:hypothetical protein
MSDELLTRLDAVLHAVLTDPVPGNGRFGDSQLCKRAAARIRELEAERDRLVTEVEKLRDALSGIAVMGYAHDLVVSARIGEIAVDQSRAALKGGAA